MAGSIKGFQFGAFQFNAFQILADTSARSGVNRLALMTLYEAEAAERAAVRRAALGPPRVTSRIVRVQRGAVTRTLAGRRAPTPRQAAMHEAAKHTYLRPNRVEPRFDLVALIRESLSALPQQLLVVRDYAAARRRRQRDALTAQALLLAFY